MSVLKMIIADDKCYVSGEPHGSQAHLVYAACARNPKSLEELDRLLPELGSKEDLGSIFSGWMDDLELEPVDAGLIVVDLAKKWIYAQDTYFGAYRRGSYSPGDDDDHRIEYEFSKEWQFVAEPKWFRYLESLGLQPHGDLEGPRYEKFAYEGFSEDDLEFDDEEDEDEISHANEEWGEIYVSDINYTNRIIAMVDFDPQNAEEGRDAQTLEHIARYDNEAYIAQKRIENAKKEIASLIIELQAVENLRKRDSVPRWEIKRIKLQAHIGKYDQGLARWTEDYSENAAMAAELRKFLATDKGRQMLKLWEEKDREGWGDVEMPF
jgi:hypothetical protein